MEDQTSFSVGWFRWMVIGLTLGLLFSLSPGGVCVIGMVLCIARLLYVRTGDENRRFLTTLFLVSFLVRALLSVGLDAGSWVISGQPAEKYGPPHEWNLGIVDQTREYVKMGDSDYLSQRGYAAMQLARGVREPVVVYRTQRSYGWNGYAYVIGAFYALFDFSPIAVKLLNCLFGALLVPVIFALSLHYFHSGVARWSAAAVAFFPSLIIWSATNLKEPFLHLLTGLLLLLLFKIRYARSIGAVAWQVVGLTLVAGAHMTLRTPVYTFLLIGCVLSAWAVSWCRRRRWRIILLGMVVIGALGTTYQFGRPFLARVFWMHAGHVSTPGMSYHYLPEEFYNAGHISRWSSSGTIDGSLMVGMGKAIGHYLVEPLPHRMDNTLAVVAYPQMVIWYILLPFALLGMLSSIWGNRPNTLPLAFMIIAWIALGALSGGNIGTVMRMRDMVTPFLVIFACAQLWRLTHRPWHNTQEVSFRYIRTT